MDTLPLPAPDQPLGPVRQVLGSRKNRPSAIFASGISTYRSLKRRARLEGWRMPRGIRVIGCGNPNLIQKIEADLELLALDFSEAGRRAYRHVRSLLEGRPVERMALLPVPYVDRQKSGRMRKAK